MRKKHALSSSKSLDLSIVIPVHNEATNIAETLKAIEKNVRVRHETIIIYDDDKDTTLPVVRRTRQKYKNIRVIKNSVTSGPSGALRTGFAAAKSPLVLVTMADLCDDLSQVPILLDLVPAKADIACPSRYSKHGRQELKSSPIKVWIPRTAGMLLTTLTGLPTRDPTNSYKLYSTKLLRAIELTSTVSFSVTLEIIAKAHLLGYRIVEIPTVWRDRQHGKTNFKLGRSLIPYLKWFCLALLCNRLFHLPISWIRAWINASPKSNLSS